MGICPNDVYYMSKSVINNIHSNDNSMLIVQALDYLNATFSKHSNKIIA